MTYVTKDLRPKSVFRNFENISKIPRSSGNEKEISDYIKKFAENLGLETFQDQYNNLMVKKPASNSNSKTTIMLQAHIDMVTEKGDKSNHDFNKDPLKLVVEDNKLRATDTTLGADNGIGIAYMMSILEDDKIQHPNLECVFTADEEVGLIGVSNMDLSKSKADYVINLDSEEEYNILVGCAGGVDSILSIRKEYKPAKPRNIALEINIQGLLGGHSGMDIDKHRANANVILGRVLNSIKYPYDLFYINGGSKRNAIPRNSEAVISISYDNLEAIAHDIHKFRSKIQKEFYPLEPNLNIKLRRTAPTDFKVYSDKCKRDIINLLLLMPNGVISMDTNLENMVETSTNFAIVVESSSHIRFKNLSRSSLQSRKDFLKSKFSSLAELVGGKVIFEAEYPAWEHAPNSFLEKKAKKIYNEVFEVDPDIVVMHCGLECGILLDKLTREADAISIGPNMYGVHTPHEYVEIDSVEKIYKYLLELLKQL